MSAGDLISRLERLGIRLWVENGRLQYDAPAGAISEVRADSTLARSVMTK